MGAINSSLVKTITPTPKCLKVSLEYDDCLYKFTSIWSHYYFWKKYDTRYFVRATDAEDYILNNEFGNMSDTLRIRVWALTGNSPAPNNNKRYYNAVR